MNTSVTIRNCLGTSLAKIIIDKIISPTEYRNLNILSICCAIDCISYTTCSLSTVIVIRIESISIFTVSTLILGITKTITIDNLVLIVNAFILNIIQIIILLAISALCVKILLITCHTFIESLTTCQT